jgi:hypothetical protein
LEVLCGVGAGDGDQLARGELGKPGRGRAGQGGTAGRGAGEGAALMRGAGALGEAPAAGEGGARGSEGPACRLHCGVGAVSDSNGVWSGQH